MMTKVKEPSASANIDGQVHEWKPVSDASVPAIYGLLIEAKKRIGAVRKEGKYDGGTSGSYNFRGVDQVTNAVAPVFNDLGILVAPEVLESTHDVYETQRQNGSVSRAFHHIIRARYTFVAAVDGSTHSVVVEGESIDYSDKGTAQTMSVAMRVALLQALTLPTDEPDPDSKRPEITRPNEAAQPEVVWDEDDNRKVRDFLKAQSLQIQRSAKVFIRSQRIPLSKLQATEEQLNMIDEFVSELLTEETERKERIEDTAGLTIEDRVAVAKAVTADRLANAGPDVVQRRGGEGK